MIALGTGPPVVLIPGVQGRWEWMRPAVDTLSRQTRVVSYSLCGEPGSGAGFDAPDEFDGFIRQLEAVLDAAGMRHATICGVSYGGLIALHFAAQRPERVAGLALVSTPGPGWTPNDRVKRYLRAPRLMAPTFVASSPARLLPEIAAAFPALAARMGFCVRHAGRVLGAPMHPALMAGRLRMAAEVDFRTDCRLIRSPTLVVTGEAALDRVVPVPSTREYHELIPHARAAVIERTGHIGLVTRPHAFARLVSVFASEVAGNPAALSGPGAEGLDVLGLARTLTHDVPGDSARIWSLT